MAPLPASIEVAHDAPHGGAREPVLREVAIADAGDPVGGRRRRGVALSFRVERRGRERDEGEDEQEPAEGEGGTRHDGVTAPGGKGETGPLRAGKAARGP